jgi:Zn-dependent metalloprotease
MKTPLLSRIILLLMVSSLPYLLKAQKTPQQIEETKQKILADPEVTSVAISKERQTPSLIKLKTQSKEYNRSEAKPTLEKYLNIRQGLDALKEDRQSKQYYLEVAEYQQFFKGVKVDRSKFKALMKDGYVALYSGSWYDVPSNLSIQPSLTVNQALNFARGRMNATKFAEQDIQEKINATTDVSIKAELQKELQEVTPKGQLVIIRDFTQRDKAVMKLAYKFNMYSAEPLQRAWVYVDANNGNILLYDPIIKHVGSVDATVQTRYAGTRTIKTKQISGLDPHYGGILTSSHPTTELYVPGSATYVLMDDTRGKGIETYDMNGIGGLPLSIPYLYIQGKSFTDVDNNWTLAEHKRGDPLLNGMGQDGPFEAENDDIAWDAHWGAGVVYDYWLSHHNRRSFDNNDSKIKSFIHYGPAYDNAFWNGSVMTYGDGSGPTAKGFKALTSLDVCGHEIGHGVCSYTSDLVYEKESGAMNEALSDIWASCIERYAVISIDPTLASKYRPFFIGEQIGADADNPLRRMDNPKAFGNPDTYAGVNWSAVDCAPDLVNDYCGVHNNSGVLNKWFYLITVGSHSGSGPDAGYARADSDDGINDLGNTYSVTGLGFDITEQVVYLMEQMLSSTATYAEAREASIAAATIVSGDGCGAVVKSVTDAWYAVGVGDKFNSSGCLSTYGFVFQPGTMVNEGIAGAGCYAENEVKVRVLVPANSTGSITANGTATANLDYRIPVTTLSNTTSVAKVVNVSVFVKNDAVIEGNETINLTVSLTNTGGNPVNTNYAINIAEDDLNPVIGNGSVPLLSNDFNTEATGYNSPAGWTKIADAGTNLWGVWNGKLQITGSIAGVEMPAGTYDDNTTTTTITHAPLIDARGLSNIRLKFDYHVQGEMDPNGLNPDNFGVFDYMSIVYSFDGVNFYELNMSGSNYGPFCSATPKDGTFDVVLPSFLNNKQFYIGFKWFNDTNAGGPESVGIDNVALTGGSKTIESDLNDNSREVVLAGQEINFYSVQDEQVLGRIKNNSTKNFDCTNVYVEKSGSGAFNLYSGNDGLQKVANKVIRIEPSLIYKSSTTITLYYTEAELAALEQATAKSRTSFLVYHSGAASYLTAAQNNTKKYVPVYTAIPGTGGSFTININDKPIGSFALGCAVSIFGAREPIAAQAVTDYKFAGVYPNPASNSAYLVITAAKVQMVEVEMINSIGQVIYKQKQQVNEGQTKIEFRTSALSNGVYLLRTKASDGKLLDTQQLIKQ